MHKYVNLYKLITSIGPVAVDDDYRVIATEFMGMLSNIMGSRAKNDIIRRGTV